MQLLFSWQHLQYKIAEYKFIGVFLLLCFLGTTRGFSQPTIEAPKSYPAINESKLADTKWRYAYTTNAYSKTPIHVADENFSHYIWLKYDYNFEQVLNGQRSFGAWALNDKKNRLFYKYKNSRWWDIVEFKDDKLVLETTDDQSTLLYVFQRLPNNSAPFTKDPTMLPEAYVYGPDGKPTKVIKTAKSLTIWDRIAMLFSPKKVGDRARDTTIIKPKFDPNYAPEPTQIEISLTGGGYYAGEDPIVKNFIMINTNGRVIREVETATKGLVKTKKDIPRKDVESLANFILEKKFFEFASLYDCDGSPECKSRKSRDPRPVPITISVKYGDRKKTVQVKIWSKDIPVKQRIIDYPAALDVIIENIQSVADANRGNL